MAEGTMFDVDLEQDVLGSMLAVVPIKEELIGRLRSSDFYYADHRLILEAMRVIDKRGDEVEPHAVVAELRDRDGRDHWAAYVFGLRAGIVAATMAPQAARRLRELANRREAERAGMMMIELARSGESVEAIVEQTGTIVDRLAAGSSPGFVSVETALESYGAEVMAQAGQKGLRTGWPSIDRVLMRPFFAGEAVYVAARTSVGKTWALLALARRFVVESGRRPLLMTLEMPGEDVAERLAMLALRMPSSEIRSMIEGGADPRLILTGNEWLRELTIWDREVGIGSLARLIRAARREHSCDVVLVDYLGLVRPDPRFRTTYEGVSDVARQLKTVARVTKTPIVIAAQLNRGADDGNPPVLANLRDSGAIEEAADRVIALYRRPDDRDPRATVLKNRHGTIGGDVPLRLDTVTWDLHELGPGGV